MIKIAGSVQESDILTGQYPPGSVESKIINIMLSSDTVYNYPSLEHLKFEINMRKSIIQASVKLNRTAFSFRVFRKSICNPEYWERTDEGGFLLKEGVSAWDAVNDICINSSKYGTECATAIVIVFYKALVDIFAKELFDRLFPRIYLMNWQHLNRNLGIEYYRNPPDYFPGDCRYFKNPDVKPETPEWQGENVIDLGNGTYYGHGIGIGTADRIIQVLNSYSEDGPETSAYLLDSATRPDFKHLAGKYLDFVSGTGSRGYNTAWRPCRHYGIAPAHFSKSRNR